jgi:hypothetical protein
MNANPRKIAIGQGGTKANSCASAAGATVKTLSQR